MRFELVDQFGVIQLGPAILIFNLFMLLLIWFSFFWNLRHASIVRRDKMIALAFLGACFISIAIWFSLSVFFRQTSRETPAVFHLWIVLAVIIGAFMQRNLASKRAFGALRERQIKLNEEQSKNRRHFGFYLFVTLGVVAIFASLKWKP
jgi:hypothetical protein